MRRSPIVWVLAATLISALTCTLLTWTFYTYWWGLAVYFWYAIPSNTFIHLPHEPAAIYAGNVYDPWLVAAVGGLATVFASGVDYLAIRKVFELERFASVKETGWYRMAVRWFRWKPWPTIVFFAFTPIPFDPVRVLAPTSHYPFWRYVTANVAGRVFVYYLLAAGGAWLPVSPIYLLLIGAAIALTPFLGLAWTRRPVVAPIVKLCRLMTQVATITMVDRQDCAEKSAPGRICLTPIRGLLFRPIYRALAASTGPYQDSRRCQSKLDGDCRESI